MEAETDSLTEQETAVYDRQIRVWGVEAQKRLSKSRVLVVGITGVVAEVCKNIVLAGIGKLTLLDDKPLSEEAVASNFLIPFFSTEDEGCCSIASICAEALRDFNPMVHVFVEEGNVIEKPGSFFDDYDAVIVGRSSLGLRKHVNLMCRNRSRRVAFYTVDCRGSSGAVFVDLQKYAYSSQKGNAEIWQEKHFPNLEEALSVPWSSISKKTSKLFFAMRIIEEFEQCEGRVPGQISCEDLPALMALRKKMCESQAVGDSMVPESVLKRLADAGNAELPPVCAIIGGILGQEVVKAMSCKGEPLKNHFFFTASDGKGVIEDISPSQ
ncbi:hypothetical protein O6H91_14G021500 [Diphasiastrum complanatum]|uniref:Uncharacterized protein n=1 Tax=Diphasiastrum complanatum TaxID=34168 RepID=A0ACC2BMC4_DIPCM|nr:hypothetical protein O6H91_14G021500 [Diphasiastrum complanatum]